jgi:hypothetical protein
MSLLVSRNQIANSCVQNILAGRYVAKHMRQLRELFPAFRFFYDSHYKLVVVTPYLNARVTWADDFPKLLVIPHGLSHAASYILRVSSEDIEVCKDQNDLLRSDQERIRLVQVVLGLVPDGILGEQTRLAMQEFNGLLPQDNNFLGRKSVWERLNDDF